MTTDVSPAIRAQRTQIERELIMKKSDIAKAEHAVAAADMELQRNRHKIQQLEAEQMALAASVKKNQNELRMLQAEMHTLDKKLRMIS